MITSYLKISLQIKFVWYDAHRWSNLDGRPVPRAWLIGATFFDAEAKMGNSVIRSGVSIDQRRSAEKHSAGDAVEPVFYFAAVNAIA